MVIFRRYKLLESVRERRILAQEGRVRMAAEDDQEREDWARLSAQALEAAYGEDEPEYSLELVKRPNPDYEGRFKVPSGGYR